MPLAAHAEQSDLSKQFSACIGKPDNTTVEMVDCMTTDAQRQDARLNKAYKEATADLTPGRKTQLQEAQRVWIKYRDLNCAFYDDPDGGPLARVTANECVMKMTASRARELESFKQ